MNKVNYTDTLTNEYLLDSLHHKQKKIYELAAALKNMQSMKDLNASLNRINAILNSTLDFENIVQKTIAEAAMSIGAEASVILLREDDYWAAKYYYGIPTKLAESKVHINDNKARHLTLAAKTKKIIVSNDALTDERVDNELIKQLGIRSFLILPLIVQNQVIGIHTFHYRSVPHTFTDEQIDFAGKYGTSISLAMQNARLYKAQQNIANTLQEALLVVPKKIKGIEFDHLYCSATEGTDVGGDFYDIFELENNKIGIIIGDVSGKGLKAATITALAKNTIKAYANCGGPAAAILNKTNIVVSKAISPSTFITVFLGILDLNSGVLLYSSAGHPPPVIKRKSSRIKLLKSRSPALMAIKNLCFSNDKEVLRSGDTLILYTDGVTEARKDKKFFGESRLIRLIRNLDHSSAIGLPKKIFKRIDDFSSGKFVDDIAILAISVKD